MEQARRLVSAVRVCQDLGTGASKDSIRIGEVCMRIPRGIGWMRQGRGLRQSEAERWHVPQQSRIGAREDRRIAGRSSGNCARGKHSQCFSLGCTCECHGGGL